ncbi:uncharacterized protein N7477_001406 [Penicillium maclennaniae]|uniref:uncharacterized protein n=1 Tax=Penicillium maclennaniae TaxID=1343394 RepID=UPI002541EF3B|nr:uncharacterized protein N7477_001406 [Penicillium maclennaniae]KAJ5681466.1 hypothetical protein N7477_001406 [Penicillium maclennaniae]
MPLPISGPHQRGQKLYQKGDFKAAIEAFGEALNVKDADAIGILDNRAATYCKLEQYDLARRDAKHMIKKGKDDDRGYLRCAKVLLLEGKPEKALEIYAYGLKVLPRKHPRREMMELLHKKLHDRMMLNRNDPFTMLPLEIAAMVIQHFTFKNIVAILRIDLSGARGKVPWTAVRSYIRRSKAMLTRAIIKNLATPSTPKTMEFLSRCPRIEHLELWVDYDFKDFFQKFKGHKQLKNLTLSPDISVTHDNFGRLLIELPRLERIALWNVRPSTLAFIEGGHWPKSLSNLKSITLATQQIPTPPMTVPGVLLPNLLVDIEPRAYPNLEELRLDWNPPRYQQIFMQHYEGFYPPLRRLDLSGLCIERDTFVHLPTSLECLRIVGGKSTPIVLDALDNNLPNLNTVIFLDAGFVTGEILATFLIGTLAPIQTVFIDQCFNVSAADLKAILAMKHHNPNFKLSELSISHMRDVNDAFVRYILGIAPDVKVLNVSHTRISGVTIRMCADARTTTDGVKLDRLLVGGCEDVSSDAVAYGRERELEVIT